VLRTLFRSGLKKSKTEEMKTVKSPKAKAREEDRRPSVATLLLSEPFSQTLLAERGQARLAGKRKGV